MGKDDAEQPREVFRKTSLEQLSSSEQLDNMLQIVSPKAWIMLTTIIVLFLALVIWVFFGSIPIKIQGKGIMMDQNSSLYNVETQVGGIVKEILVHRDEVVKKGQLLVQLYDAEEQLKLKRIQMRVDILTQDLERLKKEVGSEFRAEKKAQKSELKAKHFSVEQLEKEIADLEKLQGVQQKLYDEGLISRIVLRDTEQKLTNAKIQLETTRASIYTILYNLSKGYRTEEIKQKEHELIDAIRERDLLEVRQPYYQIYAPSDGIVLGFLASPGDVVRGDSPLIWMEQKSTASTPKVMYGYFPIEKGKRLEVGADVQIALSTVDTQEYGYLKGKIVEVSAFASSKDGIDQLIHNRELVEYLSSGALAVIQVLLSLEIDPNTHQYIWTSGKIPPVEITTGTVGSIQAIVKRIRPIYFILPLDTFSRE